MTDLRTLALRIKAGNTQPIAPAATQAWSQAALLASKTKQLRSTLPTAQPAKPVHPHIALQAPPGSPWSLPVSRPAVKQAWSPQDLAQPVARLVVPPYNKVRRTAKALTVAPKETLLRGAQQVIQQGVPQAASVLASQAEPGYVPTPTLDMTGEAAGQALADKVLQTLPAVRDARPLGSVLNEKRKQGLPGSQG